MAPALLKLLAEDAEDLEIISAALQDAVAKVGDIRYAAAGRTVTIAANRFRWEAKGERVRTALQVGSVLAVKAHKVRREPKDAVVEILAVTFEPGEAPGGAVAIMLAGGGELRLEVECIDAVLADVSQPWPTRKTPAHGV
jgi:DNA-binding protein YbaB